MILSFNEFINERLLLEQEKSSSYLTTHIFFDSGENVPEITKVPTIYLNTKDSNNPILYINGTANDSKSIAITPNEMIWDGTTHPYYSYNMCDLILKMTEELFGTINDQENIKEILIALRNLLNKMNKSEEKLAMNIHKILTTITILGKLEYPKFKTQSSLTASVKNNLIVFYNGIRRYLNLPIQTAEYISNQVK